jgi:putative ABC transport system permease protein
MARLRPKFRHDGSEPALAGYPRIAELLTDALRSTISQPIGTALTASVIAICSFVVIVATGQAVAAERAVIARVDDLGTRLITAVDSTGNAGIHPSSIEAVASLDGVDVAFGLGPVVDVTNADSPSESGVPFRRYYSASNGHVEALGDVVERTRQGETLAGNEAASSLGLADSVGVVTDGLKTWPVVGTFELDGPLASLNGSVLEPTAVGRPHGEGGGSEGVLRYMYVMASSVTDVERVAALLPLVVRAEDASAISVELPSGALELRRAVAGELGASSRQLMGTVLAIGMAIVGVTILGVVASRRRDFGRRRALGASRSSIVGSVVLQTAVAACAGTIIGSISGLAYSAAQGQALPGAAFVIGSATLSVTSALLGSLLPAVVAARRDPVAILRVP